MVKLVALVFYGNDFFNLHDTLTAVNLFLPKLIEVRSYWFVSLYFDWRNQLLHLAAP